MKTTFALFFGNRGFFPEALIAAARNELETALSKLGIDSISMPADRTRYGAVETSQEGRAYAAWLAENKGKYDGVILCLPNFGDENGASEALRDAGVPIYILAYPDELDKMDFEHRRDAFCGKFSVMDVFLQYGIPFTSGSKHAMAPLDPAFAEDMIQFAATCRVVKRMKRCRIGAIGARPTLFKTIRFDEVTLQKYGITTEVYDNSDLLVQVERIDNDAPELLKKIETLLNYTDFSGVPADKVRDLAKVSLAIDRMIEENQLDAVALRCWSDLQFTVKIAPCVILSELNDRNIVAACELDVGNAVSMLALQAASQLPAACLDWNNNYPGDDDGCILFHCGPVPQKLMREKGTVIAHKMFAKTLGASCSYGCNVGFIKPMDFTFASTLTRDGKLCFYSGKGVFTDKPLGEGFFGCGAHAHIENLQKKLQRIGYGGYRHHVSVTEGIWQQGIEEAFSRYLNYEQTSLD